MAAPTGHRLPGDGGEELEGEPVQVGVEKPLAPVLNTQLLVVPVELPNLGGGRLKNLQKIL
jgi:hypothetical protein